MGDGRNRYFLLKNKKSLIQKKKEKKKSTASWWEVLHFSQTFDPLQVDRYHPQRIFLGQHEQHLSQLEGRGWFH